MISSEVEIALLIFALYGSTCVVFAYANEGVLQQTWRGICVRLADDRLRVAGRSPIWVNPFTPMWPAFRGQWGRAEAIAEAPRLTFRMRKTIAASAKLAPYVFSVFVCVVLGIPVALLIVGAEKSWPVVALAYVSTLVLMVRLWFLRSSFSLDGRKFALLALESVACPPFAAGLVRRLSLMAPLTEDLASFIDEIPTGARKHTIEALIARCEEMEAFLTGDSIALDRLSRYRNALAARTKDSTENTVMATSQNES